jgi:uncharacterized membrane protein
VIEVAAVAAYALTGNALAGGAIGILLAVVFAAAVSLIWGTFNVPGDPSRSGRAPVPVRGLIRLLIEVDILAGAVALTVIFWSPVPAIVLGGLILVHYGASRHRIAWLLAN